MWTPVGLNSVSLPASELRISPGVQKMLVKLKRLKDILLLLPNAFRGGPIWSFVTVTRKCFQFCDHCYEWDNNVPHMSAETHRGVIDKLCELGVSGVVYDGVEPTLHPELPDFIRYAKSRRRQTYINTDLTACSNEKLKAVVDAGIDFISFSIDKVEPVKRNKRAITSLHDKLIMSKELQRQGYSFALEASLTLHKGNLSEGQAVIQYILDLGRIGLTLRPALFPIPYGDVKARTAALLTKEDIPEIERLMAWTARKKKEGHPILVSYEYMRDFGKFLAGGHRWDCGAQRDILFVEWDGSLSNCSFFIKKETPKPFIPLDMTFEDLGPGHWQKVKPIVDHNLSHCNERCYTSAYHITAYYRHHPWEALWNYFKI